MFSYTQYSSRKLSDFDMFDGIITFIKLILCIGIFVALSYEVNACIMTICVVEIIINVSKILFILFYNGTNSDYENMKKYLLTGQLMLTLPVFIYAIYNLVTNQNNMAVTYVLLYYVIIVVLQIVNFILYVFV